MKLRKKTIPQMANVTLFSKIAHNLSVNIPKKQ